MNTRTIWKWVKATQWPVVAVLVLLSFAVRDDDAAELIVSAIWLVVAFSSLVFAQIVKRWCYLVMRTACQLYPPESHVREDAEKDHEIAKLTRNIHLIFCTVGLIVVVDAFDPNLFDDTFRGLITRDLLLWGQWKLLLIVALAFLGQRATKVRIAKDSLLRDDPNE